MEPGEYEALVARASTGNTSAATELLQFMRMHRIHQPEVVVLHGGRLLTSSQGKLGSELWTVLEQVLLAAAELDAAPWRDYCLQKLVKRFPSSLRVERLKGICAESKADWAQAKEIYQKILKDKPEDCPSQKRLIAMHKQRGKLAEAIEACNTYLETFSTDAEVWHELAELYIEAGSLQRALFCYEELLVSNPRSMYHVLVYAELAYSTGDFELARKYFSLAAYLDGTNLRALWGLAACNMVLVEKDKTNEKMGQLQTFTMDRLKAAYKGTGKAGKVAIELIGTGVLSPKPAE
jgi:tetratricopeptide (TPR) repeat protein